MQDEDSVPVLDVLVPPLNFAQVEAGIYRSGYPNKKNYEFLKKIKLKTIIYLCPDDYTNQKFLADNDIQMYQYKIKGNKEPFLEISQTDIASALVKVLDQRNHPVLIHCNKGKVRLFKTLNNKYKSNTSSIALDLLLDV